MLLVGCMTLAEQFGLVALIANGYRALAYILLAVYIVPLRRFASGGSGRTCSIELEAS